MKIVIELADEIYEMKKPGIIEENINEIISAVIFGKPLPKGHGRLIDADALEKKMCDREEELGDDRALWKSSTVSVALDMFAPTIIEADREVE